MYVFFQSPTATLLRYVAFDFQLHFSLSFFFNVFQVSDSIRFIFSAFPSFFDPVSISLRDFFFSFLGFLILQFTHNFIVIIQQVKVLRVSAVKLFMNFIIDSHIVCLGIKSSMFFSLSFFFFEILNLTLYLMICIRCVCVCMYRLVLGLV